MCKFYEPSASLEEELDVDSSMISIWYGSIESDSVGSVDIRGCRSLKSASFARSTICRFSHVNRYVLKLRVLNISQNKLDIEQTRCELWKSLGETRIMGRALTLKNQSLLSTSPGHLEKVHVEG